MLTSLVLLDGADRALNGGVCSLRSIFPVLYEATLSAALISLIELARYAWTLGFATSFWCEGSYPQELPT